MTFGDANYEAAKRAWIAKQLENCPPLNERQRDLIRSAFAAHRRDKAAVAKRGAAA